MGYRSSETRVPGVVEQGVTRTPGPLGQGNGPLCVNQHIPVVVISYLVVLRLSSVIQIAGSVGRRMVTISFSSVVCCPSGLSSSFSFFSESKVQRLTHLLDRHVSVNRVSHSFSSLFLSFRPFEFPFTSQDFCATCTLQFS